MYLLNYQFTHDIDWFCAINDKPVHLASNGGKLPRLSYTIKDLVKLQHSVANMSYSFECAVNTRYLESYLQHGEFYDNLDNLSAEEFREMLPQHFDYVNETAELSRSVLLYSWSFIEMAKRGFFSFDRDERTNSYHLVAWPKRFDMSVFKRDVFQLLKQYHACCFPPVHADYMIDIPECIMFNVDSHCHLNIE